MGTYRPPAQVQRYLDTLRRRSEERKAGRAWPVAPIPLALPSAPTAPPLEEPGVLESGLAAFHAATQSLDQNLLNLPINLAAGGPLAERAAQWMQQDPESWFQNPEAAVEGAEPPPLVPAGELAKDTYVGRPEAGDTPAMQHAKGIARAVVGETVGMAASPANTSLIAATGGLGKVFPLGAKLAHAGFTAMMARGTYEAGEHAYEVYREEGWSPAVSEAAAEAVILGGLTASPAVPLVRRGIAGRTRGKLLEELRMYPEDTRGLSNAELRRLRDQAKGLEPPRDLPEDPAPVAPRPTGPRPEGPREPYAAPEAREMAQPKVEEQLRRFVEEWAALEKEGTPEAAARQQELQVQAKELAEASERLNLRQTPPKGPVEQLGQDVVVELVRTLDRELQAAQGSGDSVLISSLTKQRSALSEAQREVSKGPVEPAGILDPTGQAMSDVELVNFRGRLQMAMGEVAPEQQPRLRLLLQSIDTQLKQPGRLHGPPVPPPTEAPEAAAPERAPAEAPPRPVEKPTAAPPAEPPVVPPPVEPVPAVQRAAPKPKPKPKPVKEPPKPRDIFEEPTELASPKGTSVRADIGREPGGKTFRVQAYDAKGKVVGQITGLQTKAAAEKALKGEQARIRGEKREEVPEAPPVPVEAKKPPPTTSDDIIAWAQSRDAPDQGFRGALGERLEAMALAAESDPAGSKWTAREINKAAGQAAKAEAPPIPVEAKPKPPAPPVPAKEKIGPPKVPAPEQVVRAIETAVAEKHRGELTEALDQLVRLEGAVVKGKLDAKGKGPVARKAKKQLVEDELKLEGIRGGFKNVVAGKLMEGKNAAALHTKLLRLAKRIAKEKYITPPRALKEGAKFTPIVQKTIASAAERLDLDPVDLTKSVEGRVKEIAVLDKVVIEGIEQDAQRLLGMHGRGELESVLGYNVVTKAWDRPKQSKIRWKFHFGDVPGLGVKTIIAALEKGPDHPAHAKIVNFRRRKILEGRALEEALAAEKPEFFQDAEAKSALDPVARQLRRDLERSPEPAGRPALSGPKEGLHPDGSESHLLKTLIWGLKKPGTQESFTTQEVIDAIKKGEGQDYARIVHRFRDAISAEGGRVDEAPFDIPEAAPNPGETPFDDALRGHTEAKADVAGKYAWDVPIEITGADGKVRSNKIEARTPEEALYNAREMWPDATRITVDEAALAGLEGVGGPRHFGGIYGPRPISPTAKQAEVLTGKTKADRTVVPQAKPSLEAKPAAPVPDVESIIKSVAEAEGWHEVYAQNEKALQGIFGGDVDLFQNLLKATSRSATTRENVVLAVKAYRQLRLGVPFEGYLPEVRRNLEKLKATAEEVVPERAELAKEGYDSDLLSRAADELGWNADEKAAAAWAAKQEVADYGDQAAAIRRFRSYFGDAKGPAGSVEPAIAAFEKGRGDPYQARERTAVEAGLDWTERVAAPPGQIRSHRIGKGVILDEMADNPNAKWRGSEVRDALFAKAKVDLKGLEIEYVEDLGLIGAMERNLDLASPDTVRVPTSKRTKAAQPLVVFSKGGKVQKVVRVPIERFTDPKKMQAWLAGQAKKLESERAYAAIPAEIENARGKAGGTIHNAAQKLTAEGHLDDAVVHAPGGPGGRPPTPPRRMAAGALEPPKKGPFNWPDAEGPGTPWWDRRVAYSRARMRSRLGEASMGIDPRAFWDAAVMGADAFARGIRGFGQWMSSMGGTVKEPGLLRRVWDYLQSIARPQYKEVVRRAPVTPLGKIQTKAERPKVIRPIPKATKTDAAAMLDFLEKGKPADPKTGKPPELAININRIANEKNIREMTTAAVTVLESRFGKARSYRSWPEAKKFALEAGWTQREFLRAVETKGALTDFEIIIGRQLRHEAGLDFINKHGAHKDAQRDLAEAETPSQRAQKQEVALEMEREMNAALQKSIGIQYGTVAAGAEAGRALAAHRMWIEALTPEERFLERMMRSKKPGDTRVDDLADALMRKDMSAVDRIYREIHKPTWTSQIIEMWINSVLSGPATQMANITGNLVHETLLRTPERGLATVLDRGTRQAIERFLTGKATPQERMPGEMMAAVRALSRTKAGLPASLQEAWKFAWSDEVGIGIKGEYRLPAVPGRFGKVVRLPGRIMEGLDIGAKTAAAAAERDVQIWRKAFKEAQTERWNPARRDERIVELNRELDRYLELDARRQIDPNQLSKEDNSYLLRRRSDLGKIKTAMEHQASVSTFRDEVTKFSKTVQLLRQRYPWLTFVVPFIRTPERILASAIKRTPIGLADTVRQMRAGKLKGGEASDRLAQGIMGSMIAAGVYMLAKDGFITGGGPVDWDERRNWLATGKRPYAVKIGDAWVSMARIEPIATSLGMAADLAEATDEKVAGDIWDKLYFSVMNNITDKTYLSGFVSAAEAVGDPDRYGARFFKRTLGAFVPNLLASAARAIDPTVRQADDISTTLIARVPWFSKTLPAKMTGLGEPIDRGEDPLSRFASPFRYAVEAGPEANLERLFIETGYSPGAPPKSLSIPGTMGRKVMLTNEERQLYAAYAERATDFARRLTTNNDWESLDIYAKTEFLKRIYRFSHDAARREVHRSIMARIAGGDYEMKAR